MIALERVRLVGWHYFDDIAIPIGEFTLLAGDNGSGKSTIVDAIQYAIAANLNRIRFNAAASEKKAGRTLEGYVRGKTGVENGEYLRDDAVAHVMLQFRDDEARFCAGICIEAFKDEVQVKEYPWIADAARVEDIVVRTEAGSPLSGRAFRDRMKGSGSTCFEAKRDYSRELCRRLGVFRRNVDFNPWLDALVRSVSFSPMTSVDRFVCDYILEDRPVDVAAMKANLESYKAAEREALDVERRIASLAEVDRYAREWMQIELNIHLQEYLKARAERDLARERVEGFDRKARELERETSRLRAKLDETELRRGRLEGERDETRAALLTHDAYRLAERLKERREELGRDLAEAREARSRVETLRARCAGLLGREAGADAEAELAAVDAERTALAAKAVEVDSRLTSRRRALEDAAAEHAELLAGLPRYPEAATRLREALATAGIGAWVLADLVEVDDTAWQDAVEGWLDALRFAVLVEPGAFSAALAVYQAQPREVAGIALPDLEALRALRSRDGSLARLALTESPWARIYLDAVLGAVMAVELSELRHHDAAITQDCMAYARHTATRIPASVYARWYLGKAARERRLAELQALIEAERAAIAALQTEARGLAERGEALRQAYGLLHELGALAGRSSQVEPRLAELEALEAQIAGLDLSDVRALERRVFDLDADLRTLRAEIEDTLQKQGRSLNAIEENAARKAEADVALERASSAFDGFLKGREQLGPACEAYWAERIRGSSARILAASYEASVKGAHTRLEKTAEAFRRTVQDYNRTCNALLPLEPSQVDEARALLRRYVDSELPAFRDKIARARADAERQFKEHFVARLNEYIEEARESFREINETLKVIAFGRDQYRFTLEERPERRGQLEVIRKAADIADLGDGLFASLVDPEERRSVEGLFERILRNELDSAEVRAICDYRSYFVYDIKLKDLSTVDARTGKPAELSLSRVIREKSGGEAQTPYYVAIAASFYRYFKGDPARTVRLALFDEAFNRMDDERIGKALDFFRTLGMQLITAVPTEKLENVAPHMDSVSLVIRHGYHAVVRDFRKISKEAVPAETARAGPSPAALESGSKA